MDGSRYEEDTGGMAANVEISEALAFAYVKQTDIWSLGVTMLEILLKGADPWPNQSPTAVALLVRDQKKIPTIPPGLAHSDLEILMK